MIREISMGDKIKCLRCNKTIDVINQNFITDAYAEYICCPACNLKLDVQAYHHYGEKVGDEE